MALVIRHDSGYDRLRSTCKAAFPSTPNLCPESANLKSNPQMRLGTEDADPRRLTGFRLLWTVEHGVYRTGESDSPPWKSRAGPPYLGHGPADPTAAGPPRVVAGLLSFCTSPCLAAVEARAATRTRWQAGGATLQAADSGNGRGENTLTMDGTRGALLPLAVRFRLRGSQARCECRSIPWAGRGICEQKSSDGAVFQDEVTYLDRTLMKKPVPNGFAEAARIIHHVPWQHPLGRSGRDLPRAALPCCRADRR
jgi:hypothetical protein